MYTYGFEKLVVWRNSMELAQSIYTVTGYFPSDELYGLTSQLRRAAVSISANIAEGSGRETAKDRRKFYNTAYTSALEVLSLVLLAKNLGYLDELRCNCLRQEIEQVTLPLAALRKSTI